MSPTHLPESLALCAAVAVPFSVALLRANSRVRSLERAVSAARAAQHEQEVLLTERSDHEILKDEFISTVSHELRTPLTSVRGALGLLSAGLIGAENDKAQNLVRIAVTNTDRLIRLLNDILDLERMQSGRDPLHIRRCSLRDLTVQAIETMNSIAEAEHISINLVLAASPDAVFFDGDPDRILQVLTNLLSNAIKFSLPNGIVEVRIEADQDSVLLRVSDRGRGIPVDKLESIFDRFQQVEAADARKKGGTGLGLAICRTIIDQHSGSIWAESNAHRHGGPGASLLVTLPRLGRVQDAATSPITLLPTPREGTVILCDEDAAVRSILAEQLRQHGLNILEANTGEQAIELARSHHVDAILLDLYMPGGLSGWDTLGRLRDTSATAMIPVVILSVLSPSEISAGHLEDAASCQGWIRKPLNDHLLLAELARVLHTGDGPAHVLLVEDDAALASVVIAGLENANVHIEHATSSKRAIERCLHSRPDLLVLDLTLPHGEGFSLVDWLHQQSSLRSLPLVVYSGRDVSDLDVAALHLGPNQLLTTGRIRPRQAEELVLNIVQRLHQPAVAPAWSH